MMNFGVTFAGPMTVFKFRYTNLSIASAEHIQARYSDNVTLEVGIITKNRAPSIEVRGALTSNRSAEFKQSLDIATRQFKINALADEIYAMENPEQYHMQTEPDDLPF